MKQTASFIITTMVRLILFINFQYSINYMTSKIIRKNNRSKLVTGFYIEGYDI